MSSNGPSLHEFLVANRAELIDRSRARVNGRSVPTPTDSELANGVPLFLDQLIGILRDAPNEDLAIQTSVGAGAMLHGGDLLRRGLTVGQVVQDYGSICQSVTELASERYMAISATEFQTFNRCLDEAIAQAVTEYEHQRDRAVSGPRTAHLGVLAHEMRNLLTTAMLTFEALEKGSVGVQGSTGALLGRSIRRMRALVDRTLAEVRLEAKIQTFERVAVAELLEEIEIVATGEARNHDIQLSIDAGSPDAAVDVDRQIIASVVANLVQNAVKFTRPRGHVTIRARTTSDRVLIEVQDQCGGLPPGKAEDLFRPFEQRGVDRKGLGLGLSICLKGVRANHGEIYVRDLPGSGCMFTIDLPRAPRLVVAGAEADASVAPARASRSHTSDSAEIVAPKPSILVADDDEDIVSALKELLSGRYRVTAVSDGGQALAALSQATFDLAIVDVQLPIVDGLQVITNSRAEGDHSAPAFLVLSGLSDPQTKARALALGAVDYMTKPFESDELLARMARILATVAREASLLADAMTDSLTGLANYRSFSQSLARELERSRRYNLPLSLITLDLDHLKVINDRHGHEAGNDAIRLVAGVLTGAVRKFELVARQGGDEFAVIVPNTSASAAGRLAERLREAIGTQAVLGQRLSASIGLASWETDGREGRSLEAAALVKASDEALYRAKRGGRDRVESNPM
jgi:diguanylate cyclase (GGDEF)-like protein